MAIVAFETKNIRLEYHIHKQGSPAFVKGLAEVLNNLPVSTFSELFKSISTSHRLNKWDEAEDAAITVYDNEVDAGECAEDRGLFIANNGVVIVMKLNVDDYNSYVSDRETLPSHKKNLVAGSGIFSSLSFYMNCGRFDLVKAIKEMP